MTRTNPVLPTAALFLSTALCGSALAEDEVPVDPAEVADTDTIYVLSLGLETVRGRFVKKTTTPDGRPYNFVDCYPTDQLRNLPPGNYKPDPHSNVCAASSATGTWAKMVAVEPYSWEAPKDITVAFAGGSALLDCFAPIASQEMALAPGWEEALGGVAELKGELAGGYADVLSATKDDFGGYGVTLTPDQWAAIGVTAPATGMVDLALPRDSVRLAQEDGAWIATVTPDGCKRALGATDLTDATFVPTGLGNNLPDLAIPSFERVSPASQ
ncbi:hypothetical protein JANAI62_00170 [Jannaschia pagri]|uniref:Secreted protein n=1 Tax=Jannaschia pagri TaxID=2829797 RepID=A0ABQ4NG41_9RHOB|nr:MULTISPECIES: hypothetical protein [unclassified Jannaschia]GIT90501.1 hypothetical protein JANAI61_09590 [Jannaschia sp. AI_61]GIT93394.1 hypothetical protein JANAI62_00170 [Jannaschia sp. AI_62]